MSAQVGIAKLGDYLVPVRSVAQDRRREPVMVAGELDSELERRFPRESETENFRESLRALRLQSSTR
jgi:hypothetical protein